jgi:hypothetical protein
LTFKVLAEILAPNVDVPMHRIRGWNSATV